MPDSPKSELESTFVCDCEQWMRSACAGVPFYKEHEGKRYCVLHFPDNSKGVELEKVLQRKLRNKDFDFRGVWFSDKVSFTDFDFSADADFSGAKFSGDVNFSGLTFKSEVKFFDTTFADKADFQSTTFSEPAYFSEAHFVGEADFKNTKFKSDAVFISASLSAKGDFSNAIFNSRASFDQATFSRVEFNQATFSASPSFTNATFRATAFFFDAVFAAGTFFGGKLGGTSFEDEVCFGGASFKAPSHFDSVIFSKKASFQNVTFLGEAKFFRSVFGEKADFLRATFGANADFTYATFKGATNFDHATFLKDVKFEGDEKTGFNSKSSLNLQYVSVDRPERVSFRTLALRPHWFVIVDSRKFDFTNICWHRHSVDQELESLNSLALSLPHRMLAIACRNLAINAEENHLYEDASKFRYMAMDTLRRERWHGLAFWRLSWWYWLASGYGERVAQAFLVLLGIWFLSALLYYNVGFARWEPRLADESDLAAVKQDEVGAPLKLSDVIYSAGVLTLQKPEPRPATIAAQSTVLVETLIGPVQAALLALAIRRKFMR